MNLAQGGVLGVLFQASEVYERVGISQFEVHKTGKSVVSQRELNN